jgi:phosphoribosylformylglycinamidine synthase
MKYTADITISLKRGMLDPEANAMGHALQNLGFEVDSVSSAQLFSLTFEADSEKEAHEQAEKMCLRLLANPVIHQYTIEVRV